jgi:hypothetical protein
MATTAEKPFNFADRESRICFGIAWFDSEDEAARYHRHVRNQGLAYNGGWFDGMACGRDKSFDKDGPNGRLYAVTD